MTEPCDVPGPSRRKRYEGLLAWQACDRLVIGVYQSVHTWPKYELYGLTSQVRRAAYSTASNIAEGSAKRGPVEFRRFLDMSLGSLAELEYAFSLAHRLDYLDQERYDHMVALLDEAGRVTFGLYRSVCKRAEAKKKQREA